MTVPTATLPLDSDSDKPEIVIGAGELTINDVVALATGNAWPRLPGDPAFTRRVQAGLRVSSNALAIARPVYGVITGVGASVENAVGRLRDRVREQVGPLIEYRRLDRDIGVVRTLIGEGLFNEFASDLDR
jgi:histidine ammonia-lyase